MDIRTAVAGVAAAILAISWVGETAQAQAPTIETIILKHEPAPGTSVDFLFAGTFDLPVLNEAGQSCFTARAYFTQGLWCGIPGALGLVALDDYLAGLNKTVAPDTGGANWRLLTSPMRINGSGRTAFYSLLKGGTGSPAVTVDNQAGIWSEGTSGTLALVARQNDLAPGTTGAVFAGFRASNLALAYNDAGETAFAAYLKTGTGDATSASDTGIWAERDGSLTKIAREGDEPPGIPGGLFGDMNFLRVSLNGNGRATFINTYTDPGLGTLRGIWSEAPSGPSGLQLIARRSQVAPGTTDQFTNSFGVPVMNKAGHTVFEGVAGFQKGIWSDASGILELVALQGDVAPGTGGSNFSLVVSPSLNELGAAAFGASLQIGSGTPAVTSDNNTGIWAQDASGLRLVARKGDEAPGTGGALFTRVHSCSGSNFASIRPQINSLGQVAFLGGVKTGPTGPVVDVSNDCGLWMEDRSGTLQLVVREGDVVEVRPGESMTVTNVQLFESRLISNGVRSSFNNQGQLAFRLFSLYEDIEGNFLASFPHGVQITAGPAGDPNPSLPGGKAAMSVTAEDENPFHTLGYGWSADCSSWALGNDGSFDDANLQNPVWTGPDNTTGSTQACQIKVVVSDNVGVSAEASFTQNVSPVPFGPGNLVVTPTENYLFKGVVGGPFVSRYCEVEPFCVGLSSRKYNLENDGGSALTYTVLHATDWINIAPSLDGGTTSSGALDAGTNTDVSVSINTSIEPLCVGDYTGAIDFDSSTDGNVMLLRFINLTVEPAEGDAPLFIADNGAGLPNVTAEATGLLTSVTILAPVVTDASAFTLTVNNSGPYPIGDTFITWTAVDCSGNVETANQKVVIVDTTPPVINPPLGVIVEAKKPLTPVLGEEAIFDPNGDVSASDNVAVQIAPYLNGAAEDQFHTPVSPPLPLGPHFVRWIAFDYAFNTGVAWQSVTIVDTTPPDLTIPGNIDIAVDSFPVTIDPEMNELAVATDLVDPNPSIVRTPSASLVFDAPGTKQVKYRAWDFEGNPSAYQYQTVRVRAAVELAAMEVIQVEQDLNNSILLIGNKQTLVRAYFRSPAATTVTPKLIGFANGVRLPEELSPKDYGASIIANADVLATRESAVSPVTLQNLAANYEIPGSWALTGVTMTFKVIPPDDTVFFDCTNTVGSANSNCAVTVTFEDALPLKIKIHEVSYPTGENFYDADTVVIHKPTGADLNNVTRRLLATYPVSQVETESGRIGAASVNLGTGEIYGEPSLDHINNVLYDHKESDWCYFDLGCEQVYYGVVSGDHPGSGLADCCWHGWGWLVASGTAKDDVTAVDGAGSGNHYQRFIATHEVGHLFNALHPYWKIDASDEKRGPCGNSQVHESPDVWPWINAPGDLDPIPQSIWGSGTGTNLAGSLDRPSGRAALFGPIVLAGDESDAAYANVVIGYDSNRDRFISPRANFALMSYCGPRFKWPSKPTYYYWGDVFWPGDDTPYRAPRPDVGTFGTSAAELSMQSSAAAIETTAAVISPALGTYLRISGMLSDTTGDVEFRPFTTITDPPFPPASAPAPDEEYLLEFLDRKGNLLDQIPFDIFELEIDPSGEIRNVPFSRYVPLPEALHEVRVVQDGFVLGSKVASKNAPTVRVIYPNGGESLAGDTVRIEWEGDDKNKDPLSYMVQFSPDGGNIWKTLVVGHNDTFFEANLDFLPSSDEGLIRVQATDGFLTATDVSDGTFAKAGSPPSVMVLAPQPFQVYGGDQLIVAKAMTNDLEDGQLSDDDVQWVSDIDGPLGTGENFSRSLTGLTLGIHQLTAIGTDSDGTTGEDSVKIQILGSDFPPLVVANVATHPTTLWPPDHEMVPVRVDVNAMALPELDDPECAITSISSNEAVEGSGDGMTSEDWVVTGPLTVDLRAERSGHGSGREYTIYVSCLTGTDVAVSSGVVTVPFNE